MDLEIPQRPLLSRFGRTKAAWLQLAVPPALRGFEGIFHCPWYGLPFRQPVPMVVTIHDLTFEQGRTGFRTGQRLAYRVQARWGARTAAHILTVSETSRTQLCTRYGIEPSRVSIHPNALDPERMHVEPGTVEALRARLGVAGPYAVALGGASRRRLDLALAAWPDVRARVGDVALIVLGEPVPASLPPGVVAAGTVDDLEWAAALAGASAFVYPTEYEGFGYPALEAMAVGTPVVCAPVGALPEVVGDAGSWFETHDSSAVASATVRVLTDAGLASRLDTASRARARAASDLAAVREPVLAAYERATHARAGRTMGARSLR